MRKHFIRFLIISICFSSCQENEKYKNENLQLFENNEFYISDSVQKIIIISEQGCHSCNKTLYDFFQSNKKKSQLLLHYKCVWNRFRSFKNKKQ